MQIFDSTFEDNDGAGYGGGIGTVWTSDVTITGSIIRDNTASSYGGGAWVYDGVLTSVDCDWGSGTTDNESDDIAIFRSSSTPRRYSSLGTGVDFTCSTSTTVCE